MQAEGLFHAFIYRLYSSRVSPQKLELILRFCWKCKPIVWWNPQSIKQIISASLSCHEITKCVFNNTEIHSCLFLCQIRNKIDIQYFKFDLFNFYLSAQTNLICYFHSKTRNVFISIQFSACWFALRVWRYVIVTHLDHSALSSNPFNKLEHHKMSLVVWRPLKKSICLFSSLWPDRG